MVSGTATIKTEVRCAVGGYAIPGQTRLAQASALDRVWPFLVLRQSREASWLAVGRTAPHRLAQRFTNVAWVQRGDDLARVGVRMTSGPTRQALCGALSDGLDVMPVGADHERGVVVVAVFWPEPGGPVVLAASGKGSAVECVHSRAIRCFKSEVHRRPDRVTADEPKIFAAGCLHTNPLWRLE